MLQILMNAVMVIISVSAMQIVSIALVVIAVNVLQVSNFLLMVPVLVRNLVPYHFA